ncbi:MULTISPECIES: DUF7010 family protein [unclassified Streptomyces]|uniref:DUF7010 family protein n=1 Tax=unclassified Streptomyces TaxID=2593676 RepID=UPI000F71DB69|nr:MULTISPECIES: hypothetical protein [unclassified Streptomyces]AZM59682.1 hypothetical protein DLM49_09000 [Streptomyces sp. WAC 01438]RSM92106.1 hypothetical protein DMA10_26520 [Streptomyces sp. WAC 01420]
MTRTQQVPATVDDECVELTRRLRRRGTVVLSVFALLWAFTGASGTGTATDVVPVALEVAALLVTAVAIGLGRRKDAAPSPRTVNLPANWARGVGLVNAAEAVAIAAVIAATAGSGHVRALPAAVALVVGLHFFPLARLYDQRQYRWTGALLSAVALVGLVLTAAGLPGETLRIVVGLGCALVLWGTAYHLALKG